MTSQDDNDGTHESVLDVVKTVRAVLAEEGIDGADGLTSAIVIDVLRTVAAQLRTFVPATGYHGAADEIRSWADHLAAIDDDRPEPAPWRIG